MGVHAAQQCIVIQHLLEVGHDPVAVDGVAGEPAAELVIDAAARHALTGVLRHLQRTLGARAGVVPQQELDDHGRRELGRPAEAAALSVVLPGEPEQRPRELLLPRHVHGVVLQLPPGQVAHDLPGDLGDLVPPAGPRGLDALQDLTEGGHAVAGGGREVRPEIEGLGIGRQEHGHGPAALPRGGLYGLHVDGVHVGALFAVDLDAHKVLVQIRGCRLVLEGLASHDVAPVAARIADAEQHRDVPAACLGERLVGPGPPVDRVLGVLEEIGGRLVGQSVRHGVHHCAVPGIRRTSRAAAGRGRAPYRAPRAETAPTARIRAPRNGIHAFSLASAPHPQHT